MAGVEGDLAVAGEQGGILLEMPGQSPNRGAGTVPLASQPPAQPLEYLKDNVCTHRSHRGQSDSWYQRGWQRHKVSGAQSKALGTTAAP